MNLTPFSPNNPLEVDESTYQKMIERKRMGWTNCEDEVEWLCKLHYVRAGLKEKKITPEQFKETERRLVIQWWNRWV